MDGRAVPGHLACRLCGIAQSAARSISHGNSRTRPWADIAALFKTGVAPQGSAYGEMRTVVSLSTQHLSEADLSAAARFLTGDLASRQM